MAGTELFILLVIATGVLIYRLLPGENAYQFFVTKMSAIYEKYAPYSFKTVREKVADLGQDFTSRQFATQAIIFAGVAGGIAYFYFYSLIWALVYAIVAVAFIPYLSYLRYQRIYSEYIFEQIQIYTTNVIMEFNTTQSFVKSLEGVRDSGILENPVLADLERMIEMSYESGTIDGAVAYFNEKYPYYIVKNMNQIFLQITKEGARDAGQALENMALDIDALVEGVYRDQMDRKHFHSRFVKFGLILYTLVLGIQYMLDKNNYLELIEIWYVKILLHLIIIVNAYFLITGEKYYNEDVGVE